MNTCIRLIILDTARSNINEAACTKRDVSVFIIRNLSFSLHEANFSSCRMSSKIVVKLCKIMSGM